MTNQELLDAMKNETPVYFIAEKADFSIENCLCGTICFLSIKKDKTQAGIESPLGDEEAGIQEYRASAETIFESKDDLLVKIKKDLTETMSILEAKISKIK